jgi:hypothetical protein
MPRIRTIPVAAAAAAFATAALYLLIGFGVLAIGRAAAGAEAPNLLEFGAIMAAVFVVVGLLLLRFRTLPVLLAVGVVQVLVLVGYVALADLRVPAFELWGVLIKVLQAAVLIAVAWLVLRRERAPA